jgi:thymidylate kinase
MGLLINLEAIDRAGKSTQADNVAAALAAQGRSVAIMGFPDRPVRSAEVTPDLPVPQFATGVLINRYLDGELPLIDLRDSLFRRPGINELPLEVREAIAADIQEKIVQAIYSVNRRERARDLRDALRDNDFVFVGRWLSGYTYGVANGVGRAQLDSIEGELPRPDLTFLLDLDPEVARNRRTSDVYDRYEADMDLQARVRRLYNELVREDAEEAETAGRAARFVRVDATRAAEEVTAEIIAAIAAFEAAR